MGGNRRAARRTAARRRQLNHPVRRVVASTRDGRSPFREFHPSSFPAWDDEKVVTRGVMRALVPNLTAVLLVIHAMIGCCHHPWHGDGEVEAASIRVSHCSCCGHHGVSHDASEGPSEPGNGERECHGVCSYIPTQRLQLGASAGGVDFSLAVMTPVHRSGRIAAPDERLEQLGIVDDSPPPLRLHLLHQILLI